MQKTKILVVLVALSTPLISTLGSANEETHTAPIETIQVSLKASKHHEECILLKTSQLLTYEYQASAALKFNFHYHNRAIGETVYIIGPELLASFKHEDFTHPKNQVMCLMWSNTGAADIELNYQYQTVQN